jgi:hypothetical protein
MGKEKIIKIFSSIDCLALALHNVLLVTLRGRARLAILVIVNLLSLELDLTKVYSVGTIAKTDRNYPFENHYV